MDFLLNQLLKCEPLDVEPQFYTAAPFISPLYYTMS